MSDTAATPPIPIVPVAGDHRAVGDVIGAATRAAIERLVAFEALPPGRTAADHVALAAPYRAATERELPWVLVELDAAAAAAGVDAHALFAAGVEELWPPAQDTGRGCTDLVATAPATASGDLLVGHTNDLAAGTERDVVALHWRVAGQPTMFTWASVRSSAWAGTTPACPSRATSSRRATRGPASRACC